MQLQDTTERKVASSQLPVARLSYRLLSISCCILLTSYWLLATGYFSFAQQPAAQQKSPASFEEERLNILKADIKKEIERLEKLKKEIEEAQKALDVKIQEGLLKVAKMYESMPAEEAARKLEKLDEDVAVIILNSLKPKVAGRYLLRWKMTRQHPSQKRYS